MQRWSWRFAAYGFGSTAALYFTPLPPPRPPPTRVKHHHPTPLSLHQQPHDAAVIETKTEEVRKTVIAKSLILSNGRAGTIHCRMDATTTPRDWGAGTVVAVTFSLRQSLTHATNTPYPVSLLQIATQPTPSLPFLFSMITTSLTINNHITGQTTVAVM